MKVILSFCKQHNTGLEDVKRNLHFLIWKLMFCIDVSTVYVSY